MRVPTDGQRPAVAGQVAITLDSRPTLAPGVSFQEPAEDGGSWVVMVDGVPTSRVSRAVVTLLSAMDGQATIRDLGAQVEADEDEHRLVELVDRFRTSGLLDGTSRKTPGRLVFRPPFTLQIATLRAPGMFARLNRVFRSFPGNAGLIAFAGLTVLGVVALIIQATEALRLLISPVPLTSLVILVLVMSILTLLHESAHGLTLTRFGGQPRRAGFMIFYLTPAFFVDVTDGWRLRHRWQRVTIALAGPAVHMVFGSSFAVMALLATNGDVRQLLLLLAVACYGIVLVNLVPFVRFDGYIALMSAVDEPNLRERTKRDAARWLSRFLYGGPAVPRQLNRWWSVPFGIASMVAPTCLVLFAVWRVIHALAGGGPAVGIVVFALVAVVVVAGIVILARGLRTAWQRGVSVWRFVIVNTAIAALCVSAGSTIQIPSVESAGFISTSTDGVTIVRGAGEDISIPAGANVVLLTNGIMANLPVASGPFQPGAREEVNVPLQVLFPVKVDGAEVPASAIGTVQLEAGSGRLPSSGQARVDLGSTSVWQTLWNAAVVQPLSGLFQPTTYK